MISDTNREQVERELLSVATEDWYSVAEGESVVRNLLPGVEHELRQIVTTAILSLLEQGWIKVARLNFATGEAAPIPETEVEAVLQDDGSWNPPRTHDARAVSFTATP